jgi:spermidine/putrescine transport system substrate-binding protein
VPRRPVELRVACTRRSLLALLPALWVAGCRHDRDEAGAAPSATGDEPATEGAVSLALLAGTTARANPGAFAAEHGVTVRRDVFESDLALYDALHRSSRRYDVLVAGHAWIRLLGEDRLLYELERDLLPNLAGVDEFFLDRDFDPGNRYSVPKHYGVTGFAYRRDRVRARPATWAEFLALLPAYAGRGTALPAGADRNVGIAIASFEGDLSTDDEEVLERARRVLLAARPSVDVVTESYPRRFARGDLVLAAGTSAGFARVLADRRRRDDTVFVLPDGTSELWIASWAISAFTPHPFAAHAFIDYALSSDASARDWEETLLAQPNPELLDRLSADVRENAAATLDSDRPRSYQLLLPTPEGTQRRAEIWAEVESL